MATQYLPILIGDLSEPERKLMQAASCDGKSTYETWSLANGINKRRARNGKGGNQVYRCPHCHEYHIGIKPKKIRNKRG